MFYSEKTMRFPLFWVVPEQRRKTERHANLCINIPYLTKKYELIIIKHLSKVSREKRRHIPGLT
jgi:hypothetical protein